MMSLRDKHRIVHCEAVSELTLKGTYSGETKTVKCMNEEV